MSGGVLPEVPHARTVQFCKRQHTRQVMGCSARCGWTVFSDKSLEGLIKEIQDDHDT